MAEFTHLAACWPAPLVEIGPLRQRLIPFGQGLHLRGTILLNPQGIRLSVAGPLETMAALLREMQSLPGLAMVDPTLRPLGHQPFRKLVVRVLRDEVAWQEEPLGEIHESEVGSGCLHCLARLLEPGRREARQVFAPGPEETCPSCGGHPFAQLAACLDRRHACIGRVMTPLPGREPFDNFKPVRIPEECDGGTLLEALCHLVQHLPVAEWVSECARGRILNARHEILAADHVVRAGDKYWHKFPAVLEPDVNGRVEILHEDEALVVLNKPAPLPMHAGGRFFRNTLQHVLSAAYHPQTPRPAHRLDANTTGLVLVARTRHIAGLLQPQFARGQVQKQYLVQVSGQPEFDQFPCDAPISATSGPLGSREVDPVAGRLARTEFRVLERRKDGTTLLEAQPLTGRTHQIRVHLWHLGLPVCGDPVYRRDHRRGEMQTLPMDEPPLRLHAWRMEFVHPLIGRRVEFAAPLPPWVNLPVEVCPTLA